MMDETIILEKAAHELEEMRHNEQKKICQQRKNNVDEFVRFPRNCLRLVQLIPGNHKCMDCNTSNPQWATISYGALLCIECSGRHRHMGVETSTVRSFSMDSWKHSEVLAMLEGGNKQLGAFFERHQLSSKNKNTMDTYRTNGAKFYKRNLLLHVLNVKNSGVYNGREIYRNIPSSSSTTSMTSSSSSSSSSSTATGGTHFHQNRKSSINHHVRRNSIEIVSQ